MDFTFERFFTILFDNFCTCEDVDGCSVQDKQTGGCLCLKIDGRASSLSCFIILKQESSKCSLQT